MYAHGLPEHNIAAPDAIDDSLYRSLTQELLRFANGGNLECV